jgi:hypothetical protein
MASVFREVQPKLIEIGLDAPAVLAIFEDMANALPEMNSLAEWEIWMKARGQREAESEHRLQTD